MTTPDLSGKRVLLLGAETELGAEIARALAEAGASLALVAASNDPQTAFAVQHLARKLGARISQAIDATNEMAVRVMARQVSKELGGLDAVVFHGHGAGQGPDSLALVVRVSGKELDRARGQGPLFLVINAPKLGDGLYRKLYGDGHDWPLQVVNADLPSDEVTLSIRSALAAPPSSG